MSTLCQEYDNPAELQRVGDEVRWLKKPQKCHIATEVYHDKDAARFISATYTVTSGCRNDVLHADLAEPDVWDTWRPSRPPSRRDDHRETADELGEGDE